MFKVIRKIYEILSEIKGFSVGYSSETAGEGKMIIDYRGDRYFVKLTRVSEPSYDMNIDIDRLKDI